MLFYPNEHHGEPWEEFCHSISLRENSSEKKIMWIFLHILPLMRQHNAEHSLVEDTSISVFFLLFPQSHEFHSDNCDF